MLFMAPAKLPGRQSALGTEIRRLRKQRQLSQEDLAEALGISRKAVGEIERGDTKQPSDDVLAALEKHLHLSRQRAFELMEKVPGIDMTDIESVINRASEESDPVVLLKLWRSVPEKTKRGIRKLLAFGLVAGDGPAEEEGEQ